jgi:acyl-CoA reductase-like NAD-dependent aldehyde dehydrogenase
MDMLHIENPATGERIGEVAADDAESVAAKAAAARGAQPRWAAVPLADRKSAIARFRAALVAERETLAVTLTREVGKPIRQSRSELDGVLARIDFFLAEIDGCLAPETVHEEPALREQITHVPLGVVANVSAWNYPYFVGANVFVPALLTGNAVLYKPSEHATLTGLHIARLLRAAGVPRDVFVPVVGAGPVGAALVAQPVDGVFFTGSNATGVRIARAVQPLTKVQLELGGKDPVYVRADADPKAAAVSLADGAMYNAGQSCCAVERLYVHEAVHDAFLEHFVAAVRALRVGDPMDDSTDVGPLARAAQLGVLDAQVRDAVERGATLLCGGQRLPGPGHWYAPTVLARVNHAMTLMRDETFGPVIGIQAVRDDDDAIALMNDTRYGLTAGIYSADENQARTLLSGLRAGSVYWNCCDRVSPRLPWSGVGDSGIGLTLSREGIRTFTRPKAWHLRRP